MNTFRAEAYNENGDKFAFFFKAPNFNCNDITKQKLDTIIVNDSFYQKHGPWNFRNLDIHS